MTQDLSKFIDENVRGLKPPYSYSEVEEILQKQRLTDLNRAWEYVVKASREEQGSKEDFIKFVNEHDI